MICAAPPMIPQLTKSAAVRASGTTQPNGRVTTSDSAAPVTEN